MKPEIWDDRSCLIGAGPVALGPDNATVLWVDILEKKVLSKNFLTGEIDEFATKEDVGFVIPRSNGGYVLGTANGPVLQDTDGTEQLLPTRIDVDGFEGKNATRWNDAKVAPDGHLFLGSMTYEELAGEGALYRLDRNAKNMERVLSNVTVSNGLSWNLAGDKFFYIDTYSFGVDRFDYHDGKISNRTPVWRRSSESDGYPDGMCMDSDDGLWIAFWGGSCLRHLDKDFNLVEVIEFPVPKVSSCAFVGPELDHLVVTTARKGTSDSQSGMTFILKPGVKGVASTIFPG